MKNATIFALGLSLMVISLPTAAQHQIPRRLAAEDIPQFILGKGAQSLQTNPTVAQKTSGTGSRMISMYYGYGDSWTHTYENSDSTTYHYSNAFTSNADIETIYFWNGSDYDQYIRYLSTYDAQGRLIRQIQQEWDYSGWADAYKIDFTYDASGNYQHVLTQGWESGSWVNYYRYMFTYNASNKWTQLIIEQWDAYTADWIRNARYILDYDAAGNNTSYQIDGWDGNQWQPSDRYLDRYNANNHRISAVTQRSDGSGGWVNMDSTGFNPLNAAGLPLVSGYFVWQGNWRPIHRVTYTYTAANKVRNFLSELWDGASYSYAAERRGVSSYNSFDQIISTYTETSDHAGGWEISDNDRVERYYYEPFTTTGIKEKRVAATQIYPNPAGAELFLAFSHAPKSQPMVIVYSAAGQLVQKELLPAREKVNLDISGLSPGSYILVLQQTGSVEYLPFVKR